MHAPVEFQTSWRKSSFTGEQTCVEVAMAAEAVGVRDSKDAAGPVVVVPAVSWARLVARLRG